jgi:hypothetical protein
MGAALAVLVVAVVAAVVLAWFGGAGRGDRE